MDQVRGAMCVAIITLVVAGCGGSRPLSRAQLVKRANTICHQRRGELLVAERGQRSIRGALARGLPIAIRATRELEALAPPRELKSAFVRMIALEKASHEEIKRRLASGNWNTHGEEHAHELTNLATQLGLPDCV